MSQCPGAGVVNTTSTYLLLHDLEQATLPLRAASNPSLEERGVGCGGDWVISQPGGVVPAIIGTLSRNPALHQGLPIKQASPKDGVPAKNLVGHYWVLGSSQVTVCQKELRKISLWNQTEWTVNPTGYWTCLSLIFLTSSMGTTPYPTIEVVNKILN